MKMAIAHHLIQHNPMDIVLHIQHETEHGSALTTEETAILFQAIKGQSYERIIALAYYTGLRPNEYETAKIDGDFIVAINSKRKNKKIQYKKIPICNALRPYLDGITEIKLPIALKTLWKKFKIILPNHTLYDLRTTFYTRCKEKGVAEPALMEFVGHSMGALGNAYTDLSDEYLLRDGERLNH
jgi:integrase